MSRTHPAALVLLAACAGAPGSPRRAPAPPPEEYALRTKTRVRARHARLTLYEGWRDEVRLEGVRVDAPGPGRLRARGSAVLRLRRLTVHGRESIDVRYADRRTLLLVAREVELFQQERGFVHATRDVSMVSISDDRVTIFP
ncbi:MAG: hypothetical protein ACE5JG_05390 [Planctomycetota bacterium]